MWAWLKKLLFWWRADERLVAIFKTDCHYDAKAGFFYYHCYEDSRGKRRVVYSTSHVTPSFPIETNAINFDKKKVLSAWLGGGYCSRIPGFYEMPELEFAARVAGTDSITIQDL